MGSSSDLVQALQALIRSHHIEVARAVDAHREWTARLDVCVSTGHCDADESYVERDDACALGRWLHTMPAEARADGHYLAVVAMHARFHRAAAGVVRLVHAGRVADARAAMGPEGEYASASGELVGLLEDWRAAA